MTTKRVHKSFHVPKFITKTSQLIHLIRASVLCFIIFLFSSCGVPTNEINVECLKANCQKISDMKMNSEPNSVLGNSQDGGSAGFKVNSIRGGGVGTSSQTGTSSSFKLKGGVTGVF